MVKEKYTADVFLKRIIFLFCVMRLCDSAPAPAITIVQGKVLGITETTLRGREYYAYKGIPYAKPPLGQRRFKEPEPLDPSDVEIDGTVDGLFCMQNNYFLSTPLVGGYEDCLNLNVYTPQVTGDDKLPVMVFIHGGGWFAGGGASYIVGAKYLLDKDVVLVTFNYRLGALGFLSTGDAAAPGNYGMKDQVAVLKWVRDNIAAFGGDADSVTLFGQSAGAASVHMHMLSDMSNGLFHNAISQSGSALDIWAYPPDPLPMAQQQAAAFDCPQEDTVQLVECLRQVDATSLAESAGIFYFWSTDPITTYRPVVEQPWDGLSEEPFLTGEPLDLITQGKFQKKPWMMGVAAQDGILRGLPIIADPDLLAEMNANWTTLGPKIFDLWKSIDDPAEVDSMWKNITTYYFNDDLPVNADNLIHFIDLYSDRFFTHGAHKSALLQTKEGHSSIYMYNFAYEGIYSYADYITDYPRRYGVSHSDDLIYLFHLFGTFDVWPENHPDLKVLDSMVTLWTNFAKYGKPTPNGGTNSLVSCDAYSTTSNDTCDLTDLDWSTVPSDRTVYLNIAANNETNTVTLDFEMREGFYKQRMNFWDSSNLRENNFDLNN